MSRKIAEFIALYGVILLSALTTSSSPLAEGRVNEGVATPKAPEVVNGSEPQVSQQTTKQAEQAPNTSTSAVGNSALDTLMSCTPPLSFKARGNPPPELVRFLGVYAGSLRTRRWILDDFVEESALPIAMAVTTIFYYPEMPNKTGVRGYYVYDTFEKWGITRGECFWFTSGTLVDGVLLIRFSAELSGRYEFSGSNNSTLQVQMRREGHPTPGTLKKISPSLYRSE